MGTPVRAADLRALASAVTRLADTPGEAGLPHLDRTDELGELARAIGRLRAQRDAERTESEQQASDLQRRMFPRTAPLLPGYELAGRCLPADSMMSGDLYDWDVPRAGQLDVTVADVMGKGPGAAMAMAALRTSMRASPSGVAPARRLRRAAEAMASVVGAELFITVFYARVDLESGVFRFVDAGHGHWAIHRPGGQLIRGDRRSLPLFVSPDERLLEGEAWLRPGDSLIVYTDGLVESGERTATLEDYADDLAAPGDAAALVRRLLGRMPDELPDDVTVVVLRRARAGS